MGAGGARSAGREWNAVERALGEQGRREKKDNREKWRGARGSWRVGRVAGWRVEGSSGESRVDRENRESLAGGAGMSAAFFFDASRVTAFSREGLRVRIPLFSREWVVCSCDFFFSSLVDPFSLIGVLL